MKGQKMKLSVYKLQWHNCNFVSTEFLNSLYDEGTVQSPQECRNFSSDMAKTVACWEEETQQVKHRKMPDASPSGFLDWCGVRRI